MSGSDTEKRQALKGAFLEAMSLTAATVSIVTTDGPAGRGGVTVSAMSSVSADTPLPSLLVCLHRKGRATSMLLANRAFCVNVLRDDQAAISDIFAGRAESSAGDRFAGSRWQRGATGALRAEGALAAFDCRLIEARLVGTHYIVLGAVEAITLAEAGRPLIYSRRAYGHPAALTA